MQTSDELQLAFKSLCTTIPNYLSIEEATAIVDELNILKALLLLHAHKAKHVE